MWVLFLASCASSGAGGTGAGTPHPDRQAVRRDESQRAQLSRLARPVVIQSYQLSRRSHDSHPTIPVKRTSWKRCLAVCFVTASTTTLRPTPIPSLRLPLPRTHRRRSSASALRILTTTTRQRCPPKSASTRAAARSSPTPTRSASITRARPSFTRDRKVKRRQSSWDSNPKVAMS